DCFLSRKTNIHEKRLTILTPRKSEIGKSHFPTAFLTCFSVILSRKMKIADFRLTFSKKEFPNGAICKSFSVISTFTTYLPIILLEKHLSPAVLLEPRLCSRSSRIFQNRKARTAPDLPGHTPIK
ncbi:MAG: hypothetical protein IKG93_06410, partial [Clostridiales bacterium]|nr:hypothetical protein [Clostridiales bacterium]